ncbi:hypothetical protein AD946_15245 [Gluconobacter thailandicus]|nr:hypothetical protein AD946_15245 [Gluconobacter thailandicus]
MFFIIMQRTRISPAQNAEQNLPAVQCSLSVLQNMRWNRAARHRRSMRTRLQFKAFHPPCSGMAPALFAQLLPKAFTRGNAPRQILI